MGRRIVAFIIFLIGAGIFFLGFLKEDFACDKIADSCMLKSSVLSVNLDSMQFRLSDLKDVSCVRRTQASRGSGKRAYYELTLNINDKPYVLETCPNLKICRRHSNKLLDYKYMNKGRFLNYQSSLGVSNVMGIIMGVALIILGLKMFFDKPEPTPEEEDSL